MLMCLCVFCSLESTMLCNSGGESDLLSQDAQRKVLCSIFLVIRDGDCVGGGFFYAPGKAVTADHNLLPSQG